MPTARELLEQADLLMRRNRAGQIDTEIPELTEAISMPVIAPEPASAAVALAEIPELTDAVEEIEIASIVEMPDDDLESWPPPDDEELAAEAVTPEEASPAVPPASHVPESIGGRILPLFAIAGKPHESAATALARTPEAEPAAATASGTALAKAPVVELPVRDAAPARSDAAAAPEEPAPAPAATDGAAPSPSEMTATAGEDASHGVPAREGPVAQNDWARWEALAEEIRMQVLQRIDLFTDTRLGEQLSAQMQPIVERASAEMVATINAQIGTLLRAYIAEAIEREIEKWREGNT